MATALRTDRNHFERSRQRWERANSARRKLAEQLEGDRMALALHEFPPGDRERRSPLVEQKAAAFLAGRRVDPDRLHEEIRDLQRRVADVADEHAAEGEAWRQALEAEQQRLAERVKPRHVVAVKRIAEAVEVLSAAVEAERTVRAELADVGALHALPDSGFEFGTLADYHSVLSQWNRRMLGTGLL